MGSLDGLSATPDPLVMAGKEVEIKEGKGKGLERKEAREARGGREDR